MGHRCLGLYLNAQESGQQTPPVLRKWAESLCACEGVQA